MQIYKFHWEWPNVECLHTNYYIELRDSGAKYTQIYPIKALWFTGT